MKRENPYIFTWLNTFTIKHYIVIAIDKMHRRLDNFTINRYATRGNHLFCNPT